MAVDKGRKGAAEVSNEYLAAVRQSLRISSEDFDGEILDLIHAAQRDMILGGIRLERAKDEEDALVKRAVVCYVKAEFGLDNEDADRYRASYRQQKIALAMSSDYLAGEG